ncbi:MAG TPA: SIS domain-containing protein [Firmicutes bacterium]|nr:SIS domain-containing protein [Bacillota bacterium]HHY99087.1 SIS domain-containing protein [Bacillota bacterium]
MKLTLAEAYSELSINTIRRIYETQGTAIEKAAEKIADSLLNGGILHIFGSGHSHMISREIFGRAGQLIPVSAIVDGSAGKAERCEGYAEMLLRYYDWRPGEVVIVVSNSGRNPLPIEVALKAKKDGLTVIALTNMDHTTRVTSRHSSGRRLFEIADIVIDNCAPYGDAGIELPGTRLKAGPLSTIAGVAAINMLMLTVMQIYLERGETPPISISANLDGSDNRNVELRRKYMSRIRFE